MFQRPTSAQRAAVRERAYQPATWQAPAYPRRTPPRKRTIATGRVRNGGPAEITIIHDDVPPRPQTEADALGDHRPHLPEVEPLISDNDAHALAVWLSAHRQCSPANVLLPRFPGVEPHVQTQAEMAATRLYGKALSRFAAVRQGVGA